MPRSGKGGRASRERSLGRARSFAVSGSLLRTLRAGRGWTQAEAAECAGLSERLLRKAEAGEPIEVQSIAILAQLYSSPSSPLTPDELLVKPAIIQSQPPSNSAHIEALVRRWYDELWNHGRLEVVDELAAPDSVLHAQGDRLTRDEARQRFAAMQAAFNDFEFAVDQLAVQGKLAVVRWHVYLTHVGSWMGEPPTGERFVIHGSSWIRVENGLLQEDWDYWDQQQVPGQPRGGVAN